MHVVKRPRRRGRPALRAGEHSTAITLRLPDSQYDRVCRLAQHRRQRLSSFVRHAIGLQVADEARRTSMPVPAIRHWLPISPEVMEDLQQIADFNFRLSMGDWADRSLALVKR